MLKPKKIDISQTNIANLGSDLEKKCREAAAGKEPAWKNCGKTPGLNIWRIEKFQVKPWPRESYGTFFKGDSYIVLNTKQVNNKIIHDIHFWLGEDTTQDEAGTAAYKTVELDDFFHQEPIQHREVCNYESQTFLGLFPKGIQILDGGIDSGFTHVKPEEYKPRLLQIKGKKRVKARQVKLSVDSLNDGDVFILDMGLKIYQWNGKNSRGMEKAKAGELSRAIDDGERSGKAEVIVLDHNGPGDETKTEFKEFFDGIGGFGTIRTQAEAPADTVWEKASGGEKKLFKVSDDSGKVEFTQVASGKDVTKDKLDTSDVFVLDAGSEIVVWIGLKSSSGERRKGLGLAQDYLCGDSTRPDFLSITRVYEGGENEVFKTYLGF